ncbi:Protein Yip5/YIPF1/YIPF2 like protein [Aduncisulcus paluster]|uniref:Protein Yip5/YIPF1/YIPF2 like protein n=1 Tax=Aduncisulcus paluster TaxID=2918883 RepID=A0ABQ5K433_9EUKA|nr:Protein Yip5/YIPF1/YIPF2 like protein [Aduncisulcus paluster]
MGDFLGDDDEDFFFEDDAPLPPPKEKTPPPPPIDAQEDKRRLDTFFDEGPSGVSPGSQSTPSHPSAQPTVTPSDVFIEDTAPPSIPPKEESTEEEERPAIPSQAPPPPPPSQPTPSSQLPPQTGTQKPVPSSQVRFDDAPKKGKDGKPPFFSWANWQRFFDVTSKEFFKRCGAVLFPFNDNFAESAAEKADSWGPFWIGATCKPVPSSQVRFDDAPKKGKDGKPPFFSWANWQRFFDVTSKEFFKRCGAVLFPFNDNFAESAAEKADSWGPFWIGATCVILVLIVGFVDAAIEGGDPTKDTYTRFYVGAAMVFAYILVGPLIAFLMSLIFSAEISMHYLLCTYGYCMVPFLAVLPLHILPWVWFQWFIWCLGIVWSGFFIVKNIYKYFQKVLDNKMFIIVLVILCVIHVALFLTFKFVVLNVKVKST